MGDSYEQYMGRWSRKTAQSFLTWLKPAQNLVWLDVGCGTGALSAAILDHGTPDRLIGVDLLEEFVAAASAALPDKRATFKVGDAEALPLEDNSVDITVSALMLNFTPDKLKALKDMQRVTKPGGRVAFYVWDYPDNGMQMISHFWKAAVELDPEAAEIDEAGRFAFCNDADLTQLAKDAGLKNITAMIFIEETVFTSFDDYWKPFTQGTGQAPDYYASLPADMQSALKEHLKQNLPFRTNGTMMLKARAWGIQATAA